MGPVWTLPGAQSPALPHGPALGPDHHQRLPAGAEWVGGSSDEASLLPQALTTIHSRWVTPKKLNIGTLVFPASGCSLLIPTSTAGSQGRGSASPRNWGGYPDASAHAQAQAPAGEASQHLGPHEREPVVRNLSQGVPWRGHTLLCPIELHHKTNTESKLIKFS